MSTLSLGSSSSISFSLPSKNTSSSSSSSSLGHFAQCCLVDQYKYAFYVRFREPKLYRHVVNGDWELIPSRCKTHPKEVLFVHKYAPNDTALQRLLGTPTFQQQQQNDNNNNNNTSNKLKFQAAQAMLQATCPDASVPSLCPFALPLISIKNVFGRNALHVACMDIQSNLEIIVKLLLPNCSRQVCMETDIEKRTPLHYFVARNDEIHIDLLKQLIALAPNVLSMTDQVGETPFQIVQARQDEIINAKEVLEAIQSLQQVMLEKKKNKKI